MRNTYAAYGMPVHVKRVIWSESTTVGDNLILIDCKSETFFSLSNEFQNFYVTDNHNERCILEFTLIESKVSGKTVLHSGNIFSAKILRCIFYQK